MYEHVKADSKDEGQILRIIDIKNHIILQLHICLKYYSDCENSSISQRH